jgi:structure-specific recognition protein 1
MATETWNSIVNGETQLNGKFTFGPTGIVWTDSSNDEKLEISMATLKTAKVTWMNARPRCHFRVLTTEGEFYRFMGFRASDYEKIRALCPAENAESFGAVEEPSVAGKQFGHLSCENKTIRFSVDDKVAFEMPTKDVSQCVFKQPSSLEIQIDESGGVNAGDDCQLVQMSFWVPTDNIQEPDVEEDEEDTGMWGQKLASQILVSADIESATGEMITQFSDDVGTFKCPRGRYSIELYKKFFRMYGTTYNEKIKYEEISALFLLNHPDYREHSFVISLREDKKVIQGNQRFQHLVLSIKANKELSAEIFLSEKECIEQYGKDKNGEAALKPRMAGDMHTLIATIFKVVSRKKVYISTPKYKNFRGGDAVHATLKSHSGLLFPMQRNLLFIHRPTVFIKYEDIQSVEFERYTGPNGSSHTFDLRVQCKSVGGDPARDYFFSSIGRDEYSNLLVFLDSKQVTIHGQRFDSSMGGRAAAKKQRGAFAGMDGGDSSASGGEEENSSEDEDFTVDVSSDGGEPTSDSEDDEEDAQVYSDDEDMARAQKDKGKKKHAEKKRKAGEGRASTSRKKLKKTKAAKDPNAPKRPQSSYFLFLASKRDEVSSANPDMSVGDKSKILGSMWKALSEEEKKPFEDQYAEAKAKYETEYAEYLKSDGYKVFRASNPKPKKGKKGREKKVSPYPPKPTKKSAWVFFNMDKGPMLKDKHPSTTMAERTKMASALWKEIDGTPEKAKYEAMASKEAEEYAIAMQKWKKEKKMIHDKRKAEGLTDSSGSELSETSESSESSGSSGSDSAGED